MKWEVAMKEQGKKKVIKKVSSALRKDIIMVPEVIEEAPGIQIFGRTIKSLLFSTDVATITYSNADAILAVYPFTPHPSIISAILQVASQPVFAGVGGGKTQGMRSVEIALLSEAEGALGVVCNAPMPIETIQAIEDRIDSPIISTVISEYDLLSKLNSGVDILNVANGRHTVELVKRVRDQFPDIPIIATGGKSEENIKRVIEAGADAISWTPPTNAELFQEVMDNYRDKSEERFMSNHDGLTLDAYEDKYNL